MHDEMRIITEVTSPSEARWWESLILPSVPLIFAIYVVFGGFERFQSLLAKIAALLFFCGFTAYFTFRNWRSLRASWLRFTQGPATVVITSKGFVFERRNGRETYEWTLIDWAKKNVEVDKSGKKHHSVSIEIDNVADIVIEDDEDWRNFRTVNQWAGGLLEQKCT